MIGKYVIVRSDGAGVFAGTLERRKGREVTLSGCRRLWFWAGATECLQLAAEGVSKPNECKFTVTVDEIVILDAIEVIPCSATAEASIKGVSTWKA